MKYILPIIYLIGFAQKVPKGPARYAMYTAALIYTGLLVYFKYVKPNLKKVIKREPKESPKEEIVEEKFDNEQNEEQCTTWHWLNANKRN